MARLMLDRLNSKWRHLYEIKAAQLSNKEQIRKQKRKLKYFLSADSKSQPCIVAEPFLFDLKQAKF